MNNDEKKRKNNAKWRKDRTFYLFYLVIILISEYSILWVLDSSSARPCVFVILSCPD